MLVQYVKYSTLYVLCYIIYSTVSATKLVTKAVK